MGTSLPYREACIANMRYLFRFGYDRIAPGSAEDVRESVVVA